MDEEKVKLSVRAALRQHLNRTESGIEYAIQPKSGYGISVSSWYDGELKVNLKIGKGRCKSDRCFTYYFDKNKQQFRQYRKTDEDYLNLTVSISEGYKEFPQIYRERNYELDKLLIPTEELKFLGKKSRKYLYKLKFQSPSDRKQKSKFILVSLDGMVEDLNYRGTYKKTKSKWDTSEEDPFDMLVLHYHTSLRKCQDMISILGKDVREQIYSRNQFYRNYRNEIEYRQEKRAKKKKNKNLDD